MRKIIQELQSKSATITCYPSTEHLKIKTGMSSYQNGVQIFIRVTCISNSIHFTNKKVSLPRNRHLK